MQGGVKLINIQNKDILEFVSYKIYLRKQNNKGPTSHMKNISTQREGVKGKWQRSIRWIQKHRVSREGKILCLKQRFNGISVKR